MYIKNNYYNLALIIAFILLLILPTIDNIFNISSNIKIDLKENRTLAKLPDHKQKFSKLFKKFPTEFDNYYNDNFGFRNIIIWVGRQIFPTQGNTTKNSARYFLGINDWIFLNEGKMKNNILGLNNLKNSQIKKAVATIYENWLYLKKRNIDYVLIIAPNKQTIYPEFLPDYLYLRYKKKYPNIQTRTDQIKNALLKKDKNFPIIDLRNHLKSNKENPKNYILYDKTDTHWNGYGIKIAYEEIYRYLTENLNIKLEKTKFLIKEQKINTGDLANMAGKYPYYNSTKAFLVKKKAEKIENSNAKNKIKEISKKNYGKDINIHHYKKHGDFRAFVQHDSFFMAHDFKHFIANSINGQSLFADHVSVCKLQKHNISYYKPNLVIHEMVERHFVTHCIK